MNLFYFLLKKNEKREASEQERRAFIEYFKQMIAKDTLEAKSLRVKFVEHLSILTFNNFEDFDNVLEKSKEVLPDEYFENFVGNILNNEDIIDLLTKHKNFIEVLFNFSEEQSNKFKDVLEQKLLLTELPQLKEQYQQVLDEKAKLDEEFAKLKEDYNKQKRELAEANRKLKKADKQSEIDLKYINEAETYKHRCEQYESEIEGLNELLKEKELQEYIDEYENNGKVPRFRKSRAGNLDESLFIKNVKNYLASSGLCYDEDDIYNFHISIKSSPLVILAGSSGLGKTRLPLAYAKCINANESDGTLLFLPISPSYTEPSDVLGYYNSTEKVYVPSNTGFVDFLINAQSHPERMHMVVFDEMNLSQIEYWFAPFMSILEKDLNERILPLYTAKDCKNEEEYPSKIQIGENVIFVGTINLDETTKDMSDRLIDRAIVIKLKKQSFIDFYNQVAPEVEIVTQCECAEKFYSMKNKMKEPDYIRTLTEREVEFLDELHKMLQRNNSSKGVSFRNIKKICSYITQSPENSQFSRKKAFDYIFKQTILKKLNGYDASISTILGKLNSDDEIEGGELYKLLIEFNDISDFTNTINEIKHKIKELNNYGFTR